MKIDTRKLGPWTQAAIELKLTPELVDLCLNVDINIVMDVHQFEHSDYTIRILPDQGVFYIETSMIRYEHLEEDLYAARYAIMSKELTISIDQAMDTILERMRKGMRTGVTSNDGIIASFWISSIFTSLSFNIALLDLINTNKVGVQIVGIQGEFSKEQFHWVPGFDEVIDYIIGYSANITSYCYRDVIYNAINNHVLGYTLYNGSTMVRTPVESEVTIGHHKFISGTNEAEHIAYLVNGERMIRLNDIFYGEYNNVSEFIEYLNDNYDELLQLMYSNIIKYHATDVVNKRKRVERTLSDIDKYQFITNSLNNSICRANIEPTEEKPFEMIQF